MKLFIIAIISLIFLSACQTKEVIKTHGISYLDKREKLIVLNKSNKNDVVNVLGHPATKGMTDENLWIYIERTQTRGKLTKMGRNYLKKNNVLVISFDTYGIVNKKEFYDKNNMKKIEFAKAETVNDIKSENFIYCSENYLT